MSSEVKSAVLQCCNSAIAPSAPTSNSNSNRGRAHSGKKRRKGELSDATAQKREHAGNGAHTDAATHSSSSSSSSSSSELLDDASVATIAGLPALSSLSLGTGRPAEWQGAQVACGLTPTQSHKVTHSHT